MRQQQAAQTPIATVMHTDPYRVTAQQPVRELLALFVDKGISAAPVVDEQGRPIGFVSKTDVVRSSADRIPGNAQRMPPRSSPGGMQSAYRS